MLYVNPLAGMNNANAAGMAESPARRRMALEEMEHYFIFTLMQEMRKSVPEDTLLGHTSQRAMFEEMLDDAFAGAMAKSKQFGLASQIEQQLRTAELQRAMLLETKELQSLVDQGLSFK